MRLILAACVLSVCAATTVNAGGQAAMHDNSAATYEHLATAIIEIRATEDMLVQGILTHYSVLAQRELGAAAATSGSDRKKHLEAAAEEITNVANEGDKKVQAVRQRLLKAGHHHHTDSETQEDYIFVDGKEKKLLLAMAEKIAKLGDDAPADVVNSTAKAFASLFEKVIAAE